MELKLDLYQEKLIKDILLSLERKKNILVQLSTGGGKTVIFSHITNEYIKKTYKSVLILVHRKELLKQTESTMWKWHRKVVEKITSDKKNVEKSRIYVAMINTLENRIKKSNVMLLMKNVDLVIIDEAHISNFKKIFPKFETSKIIGFTATPIAATKKDPLKNYYEDIIVGTKISNLIELNKKNNNRGLVQNITYSLSKIDRNTLRVKGDDFDEEYMASVFSNPMQITNTINAYLKYASNNHQKAICFNSNIKHSKLVTEAMINAGLNARHLDANDNDDYRNECFKWLKNTPNAILCNAQIATTGFDEPSIETVIVNSATKSLTNWLQKCGRGARPHQKTNGTIKENFLILDLGGNALEHGDWCEDRDWKNIFLNPDKPQSKKTPYKVCPECNCINATASKVCIGCHFEFSITSMKEDNFTRELTLITNGVDVTKIVKLFNNKNEYHSFLDIIKYVADYAKNVKKYKEISDIVLNELMEIAKDTIKEWIYKHTKEDTKYYTINFKNTLILELINIGYESLGEKQFQFNHNEKINVSSFEKYTFDLNGNVEEKNSKKKVVYSDNNINITDNEGIIQKKSLEEIKKLVLNEKIYQVDYEKSKIDFLEKYNLGKYPNYIQVLHLINYEKRTNKNVISKYFGEIHKFILNEKKSIDNQLKETIAKSLYYDQYDLDYLSKTRDKFFSSGINERKQFIDNVFNNIRLIGDKIFNDKKQKKNQKYNRNLIPFSGKLNSKESDRKTVISLIQSGITSEKEIIRYIYGSNFSIGGEKGLSNDFGENPRQQIHTIRVELAKKIKIELAELDENSIKRLK